MTPPNRGSLLLASRVDSADIGAVTTIRDHAHFTATAPEGKHPSFGRTIVFLSDKQRSRLSECEIARKILQLGVSSLERLRSAKRLTVTPPVVITIKKSRDKDCDHRRRAAKNS